jgi:hypothetical protein
MVELKYLYKSITADKSQICDGRSRESLAKMLKNLQIERSSSSNNLLSHTVSCNDAKGNVRSHSHELNLYRPISLSTDGGRKTASREKKAGSINDSAGLDISPDDVNAISKVADWFENNLHLQPPKMPFDGLQAPASNTKSNDEAVKFETRY